MSWFNYYGLIAMAIIMLPNIICAFTDKNSFNNGGNVGRVLLVLEQVGR